MLNKQISRIFKIQLSYLNVTFMVQIPRGLTARIAGFHPAGPGSTPGVGKYIILSFSDLKVSLDRGGHNFNISIRKTYLLRFYKSKRLSEHF